MNRFREFVCSPIMLMTFHLLVVYVTNSRTLLNIISNGMHMHCNVHTATLNHFINSLLTLTAFSVFLYSVWNNLFWWTHRISWFSTMLANYCPELSLLYLLSIYLILILLYLCFVIGSKRTFTVIIVSSVTFYFFIVFPLFPTFLSRFPRFLETRDQHSLCFP